MAREVIAGLVVTCMLGLDPAAAPARQARPAPEKAAFLTAEEAGPDFAIQGEYLGSREGLGRLGAQVVAEGNGAFAVVFYPGGLPGEGWDARTRRKAVARREGEGQDRRVVLSGDGWAGTIGDGAIAGTHPDGSPFTLRRVARASPTAGLAPPPGAVVLFDGTNTDAWNNGRIVEGGLLGEGPVTRREFRDYTLHMEFRTPFMPLARGQGRGNSGIKMLSIYEVQILDSFGLDGRNNECGALYTRFAPPLNMAYPPLSWQTFDIDFRAPRFDTENRKIEDARITVRHNGILLHDDTVLRPKLGQVKQEKATGPVLLQNHGNPVYFRNIWLVENDR